MKLGSLFDGSGTCPLAARMCGIEPVWASEIEPYPIRVTQKNFPGMQHLGDIKQIDGAKIEPVDVITFGSPCQDLSTAGKQAGLIDGERSSLFFEAIRIIREMREATNGKYPRYAVWENVPGAFGSNRGRDFLAVLRAFAGVAGDGDDVPAPEGNGDRLGWSKSGCIMGDGYSIAWRQLDAQYWGVPQRRRRIYLVADFDGQRAGKILFEREGLRGDSAEGREARQGTAGDAERGVGGSDRVKCLNPWDCQSKRQYTIDGAYTTLNAGQAQGGQMHGICYNAASFMGGQVAKAGGIGYSEEVSPTLKSVLSGGNTVPDVVYPEIARTLAARHDSSPCADRGQNVVALDCRNLVGNQEISGTLQAKDEGGYSLNYVNPVVYDCRGNGDGCTVPNLTGDHENRVTDYTAICVGNVQLHQTDLGDKTGALNCMHDQQAIIHKAKPPRKYIIRRLTPLECNRLQGFPDSWGFIPHKDVMTDEEYQFWTNVRNTHISINGRTPKSFTKKAMLDWYNKLHTDSAEYKMWGNGMALPCVLYVMQGIAEAGGASDADATD